MVGRDTKGENITPKSNVLITRDVHQLWRDGYENGTLDPLNDVTNPP